VDPCHGRGGAVCSRRSPHGRCPGVTHGSRRSWRCRRGRRRSAQGTVGDQEQERQHRERCKVDASGRAWRTGCGETAGLRRQTEALTAGRAAQHSGSSSVHGARHGRCPGAVASLEPCPLDRPAAGHRLGSSRRSITARGAIGGPLEQAIAGARRALPDPSPLRLDTCLRPWLDRGLLRPIRSGVVEPAALAAVGEVSTRRSGGDGMDQTGHRICALTGLWGPLLAYEQELRRRRAPRMGARRHVPRGRGHAQALRSGSSTLEPLTSERWSCTCRPRCRCRDRFRDVMSVNTVKTHLKSIYRKTRRRTPHMLAREFEGSAATPLDARTRRSGGGPRPERPLTPAMRSAGVLGTVLFASISDFGGGHRHRLSAWR
jgi:hypothetical protein